jgi:hypothetical protein
MPGLLHSTMTTTGYSDVPKAILARLVEEIAAARGGHARYSIGVTGLVNRNVPMRMRHLCV